MLLRTRRSRPPADNSGSGRGVGLIDRGIGSSVLVVDLGIGVARNAREEECDDDEGAEGGMS